MNMNATPLLEFSGNEVYGATSSGLTAWWINTFADTSASNDERSVIKDLVVWNVYSTGYNGYPTYNLTIDGMVMRGDYQQFVNGTATNYGIFSADYSQLGFLVTNSDIQGVQLGFIPSTNSLGGPQIVENSYFHNMIDICVSSMDSSASWSERIPARTTILRNDKFNLDVPTGSSISPLSIGMYNAAPGRPWAPYNLVQSDQVYVYDYNQVAGDDFQVYYLEQAPDYVMMGSTFNDDGSIRLDASPQPGLTNQQLWDLYHVAFAGAVSPTSTQRDGIHGFVQPI